jgi:hypothetical protein
MACLLTWELSFGACKTARRKYTSCLKDIRQLRLTWINSPRHFLSRPSTAIWTLKPRPFQQRKFAPQWSASCAVNTTMEPPRCCKGATRRSADTCMQDTRNNGDIWGRTEAQLQLDGCPLSCRASEATGVCRTSGALRHVLRSIHSSFAWARRTEKGNLHCLSSPLNRHLK